MHATIASLGPRQAVCRFTGSLDHECLEHLRATMAACSAFDEVNLDLSGVVFIDSGALGVIVGATRRIHERGGSVVAWGARSNIRRLLSVIGFDRVVPVRNGAPAAVGAPTLIAS